MHFRIKSIIILVLLVIPQIGRANLNFLERFLLSDKAYAKQIEVQAYILSENQSAFLLADPLKNPKQLIGSELSKFPKKYLVIRVKNLGDKHAWGTLTCSVPGIWDPLKIPIISIQQDFCNYLICVEGFSVVYSHDTFAPKITFEWDELYTK